ncbi:protease modulator HflC [Thermobrachium celere]|uniref:Protein HflC n=1 Tax=Thermobrachium celere DSM 8682 TaxID=941824 RepID=R7RUZ8_9CLOT|nr:protease modulator HflC [Thermobrachium celere]GFR36203.1 protein HflC [Thermobrachium celere]CDF59320.1 HflC protein [Thermobrachium celere DSM 8682]
MFKYIRYILIVALLILFTSSTFIVKEQDQVVVSRFGEIKKIYVNVENYDAVKNELSNDNRFRKISILTNKGLCFKVPFIDSVTSYDSRLLTYDTSPCDVITGDKKKLILDNYAQWRITNPALFKITMGNIRNAHIRIDDILYSKIRERVSLFDADDLVGNKDINQKILNDVIIGANKELSSSGIQVFDFRIKNIMLPAENRENIYNRMKTEREQMAKKYRSEGEEEYLKITSNAQKEATIIEAEAYEKAQKLKGEGDAEATRIYNEAFNRDPEFYKFYRSMQAYKKIMNEKVKLVIPEDSEFAKYLFNSK